MVFALSTTHVLAQSGPDDAVWSIAKDSTNDKLIESFIAAYPNSRHVEAAKARLAVLRKDARSPAAPTAPAMPAAPATPGAPPPASTAASTQVTAMLNQIEGGFILHEAMEGPMFARCTRAETSIRSATTEVARIGAETGRLADQARAYRDRQGPGTAATAKALGDLAQAAATIAQARQGAAVAKQAACERSAAVMQDPHGIATTGHLAEADKSRTLAEQQIALSKAALQRIEASYAASPAPAGSTNPPEFAAQLDALCTELATLQDAADTARRETAEVRVYFEPLAMTDRHIGQLSDPALLAHPDIRPHAARVRAISERYAKLDKRRSCSPETDRAITALDAALPAALQKCWQVQATATLGLPGSAARASAQLATMRRQADETSRLSTEAAGCVTTARNATTAPRRTSP
ncbi:MAG: hypothetical protein ACT4O6_24385 [Reyranella sp.]